MPAVAKVKSVAPLKDLYDIGEIPPLGHVPEKMHAWVIRKERHGPPDQSFQREVVPTWPIGEDEVLLLVMAGGVHCNQDDGDDEDCNGGDPLLSPSQRIWGYETPDGSFAQFCRVQSRQLMHKPNHLSWEESACYTLTLATAYRMLFGHSPHTLKPGDNV